MLIQCFSTQNRTFLHWRDAGERCHEGRGQTALACHSCVCGCLDRSIFPVTPDEGGHCVESAVPKTRLQNLHFSLAKQFSLPRRVSLVPAYFYCWHLGQVTGNSSLLEAGGHVWDRVAKSNGRKVWLNPYRQKESLLQNFTCPMYHSAQSAEIT